MKFAQPLIAGRLLRRYQRFLTDVELDDGTLITAACPNTGSMLGCCTPGNRVWLSQSDAPTRKYRHTWEMVEVGRIKVGINTGLPNKLVREAIENGVLAELGGYESLRGEVPFGIERSRIDLLLQDEQRADCYVEVKNVTAAVSQRVALFPDAVSARGAKHLRELMRLKASGLRAVLVYCVQRGDVDEVRPADGIDPLYGRTLREAIAAGVEVLAYRAKVTTREVALQERIAVVCPPL
jgi:sugar fermentation stimulation protein A